MVCRHSTGDPNCGKTIGGAAWRANQAYSQHTIEQAAKQQVLTAEAKVEALLARTPNPERYSITKHEQVGEHLVLEVQYSSCKDCSFDARKCMVFLHTDAGSAMYWNRIDPHFADIEPPDKTHAPTPRARFPADAEGWVDAIAFARGKAGV